MTAITAADIAAQIAAIDGILADLEAEAARLSYSAVGGDADAAKALVEINTKVAQVTADRVVLTRATVAAHEIEETARLAALEAARARHLEEAKAAAAKLLAVSERADALTRECAEILVELSETEQEVRHHFQHAGTPIDLGGGGRVGDLVSNFRMGRKEIAAFLMKNLNNCLAKGDFATKRSVSDLVRVGWAELLDEAGSNG